MKTVINSASLFVRLGLTAAALLLSQQVLAAGTDAGTPVSNQATVAYDVNTQGQTPIESDPAGNSVPGSGNPTVFVVDRRVDFTIVEIGGLHTEVQPGDTGAITEFQLTNTGNAIMDFDLSLFDLTSGDPVVHGELDTDDVLINFDIRVANGDGIAGVPDGTDLAFVDELGEEEIVVIYVFAEAGAALPNDAYDNFRLDATAADDPAAAATLGVLDPLLLETPGADDPTLIENVFANASGTSDPDPLVGNAIEGADDGYHVNSAQLVISKDYAVVANDLGSGKPIPGATIEYTITVDNSLGGEDADNVSISDAIDTDVTFLLGAYGGAGQDISLDNGGATSTCSADLAGVDTDGCSLDVAALVVGNATVPITVAAGEILTVQFQVEIPAL